MKTASRNGPNTSASNATLARVPDNDPNSTPLRKRERELGQTNLFRWTAKVAPLVEAWKFNRGVIDSVSVDAARFLASGEAIFDLAPIRKVRFLNVADQLKELSQSPLLRLIRELDFTDNNLGDRVPALLGKSRHLVRLDALDLAYTDLGDDGLKALAASPVFGSLRSLQLAENRRIGLPGIRALAESPHLRALAELDVSGNNLSEAALRPLFDGPLAEHLIRLMLSGNGLGDAGVAALCASPVFARMAEDQHLIDLRRVDMGPGGAKALADSAALEFVESLDLEGNMLGDAGLAALASSPHLTQLRVLSLRENRIEDAGVWALSRSPLMATLRVLDLTGNLITQESQDRLQEASRKHDWRGLVAIESRFELAAPGRSASVHWAVSSGDLFLDSWSPPMRFTRLALFALLPIIGCQKKATDSPSPPTQSTGTQPVKSDTSDPAAKEPRASGDVPATGLISGKPFTPDKVTLQGRRFSFRQGKEFFPDMEIAFELPQEAGTKLEGKELKFGGKGFGDPTVSVSHKEKPDGLPKGEFVFPADYTLTLKITKHSSTAVEGTIDLQVTKPANTRLAGKFSGAVKKSGTEPLDADDVPYVHGKIVLKGQWKKESLAAGFIARGTDGKSYSNMAGTTFGPDGTGSVICTSFEPQLTSIINSKDGPVFRHTRLAPGNYFLYVRRGHVIAAWKNVTVKAGDKLSVDLTIDLANTGSLLVTLPDDQADIRFGSSLRLIPINADLRRDPVDFAFDTVEIKKGQKTANIKDIPAGKYRVSFGKSEAEVEIAAGKEATVTLKTAKKK